MDEWWWYECLHGGGHTFPCSITLITNCFGGYSVVNFFCRSIRLLGGQDFFTPFAPYNRVLRVPISCDRLRTVRYIASAWCLHGGSCCRNIRKLYTYFFISWDNLIDGNSVKRLLFFMDNFILAYFILRTRMLG